MHVAVDLDGTLVSWDTRQPINGAARALRSLSSDGVKLILHTCRTQMPGGMAEIEQLLASHPFAKLDIDVWTGPGKPVAAAYVDDRGVDLRGDWVAAEKHVRWLLTHRPENGNEGRPRS